MRFRFCGDLDCPDWLLAEISTLSKLTSVKMKLFCGQIVKGLLSENTDFEKVSKLTEDAKFEQGDVKASVAAVDFILTSAARFSVEGEVLSNELQQLGLPKELTMAVCKAYTDNLMQLREKLKQDSLRLKSYDSIDWRVDYIVSSTKLEDVSKPSVQLRLKCKDPDTQQLESTVFTVSPEKFSLLLAELKQAHSMMEAL